MWCSKEHIWQTASDADKEGLKPVGCEDGGGDRIAFPLAIGVDSCQQISESYSHAERGHRSCLKNAPACRVNSR